VYCLCETVKESDVYCLCETVKESDVYCLCEMVKETASNDVSIFNEKRVVIEFDWFVGHQMRPAVGLKHL
jgi:hypothetical protein